MPRPKKQPSVSTTTRRSIFDLKRYGITPDATKDYRWVRKDRIDERKEMDGYGLTKGTAEDGTTKAKGMVLMERSRDRADESRHLKEARIRQRTQSTKAIFGEEIEKLSKHYDTDLHKAAKDLE